MNKKTIMGLAALTAVALGSGVDATTQNLVLNSNTPLVEASDEGKINLCTNNLYYKPTISAKVGTKTRYYLDGSQLVSMLVNNDSIRSYDYVPTFIYGGMCSSANRKTQYRKAIEYMNGEGLEITRDDSFPTNFNDNNVYTVVFAIDGYNNSDDLDGNEYDFDNSIRINYKYKTINGVRRLDYMNVWASNTVSGGGSISNGDSVNQSSSQLIWEVNSSNLNSTSDGSDVDGTINVDGIEYGYYYESLEREFDLPPGYHDDDPTLFYTSVHDISKGIIKDGKYTNVTSYNSVNKNIDRMGTDEDLFRGIANHTFYLGQTNYPSDNNYPTITGPTYIINVDNPLTLEQIKSQLKATDPTEGDITDRIEIINCNYILVNGKIDKGIYSFTAKVSDSAGNETTKDFTILVRDAVAPTITAKTKTTGNSTCLSDTELRSLFTATDNYDDSRDLTYEYDLSDYKNNYKKVGTYTISCKVTDDSGNSSSKTTTITVTDTTKPVISGVNKTTGNSTCLSQTELKTLFTYSDDTTEKANLKLEITSDNYTANYRKPGSYQVTAKVTDAAGNYQTATITITVTDTTKPTITGTDKTTGNSICLSQADLKKLFTISDDVTALANLKLEITSDGYTTNYKKPGTYQVTAKATDQAGNSSQATITITVTDTTKPVVTATNKSTGNSTCLTQDELKALFTYSDDVTATQSLKLTITSDNYTANYRKPGKYNVVVTVTDLAGNVGTATAVITVTDTTKPTITATNKSQSYTTKLSQDQLKALFTISDDVSPKANLKLEIITDNYSSKFSSLGQYTVIAKVTDEAGNYSQATATITVIDDVKPVISFNSKIEIDNLSKRSIDDIKKFVSVTDAKSAIKEHTLTDSDDYANNYNKPGEYHFEVVAVDSANNKATATLTITVLDKDVPEISWKSDYIILVEEGDSLTVEKILNILISSGQLKQSQATDVQSTYFNNEAVPGEYDLSVATLSGSFVKAKIRVLQSDKKIDTPATDDNDKKDDVTTDDESKTSFFEQYKYIIYTLATISIIGLLILLILKKRK